MNDPKLLIAAALLLNAMCTAFIWWLYRPKGSFGDQLFFSGVIGSMLGICIGEAGAAIEWAISAIG